MADKDARQARRARAGFLVILGLVFVGLGASIYYGELDVGSLTKGGTPVHSADAWGYLPVGLGVVLMAAGILFALSDRKAR